MRLVSKGIHQMVDAVHGEGTSQRMHEAMGGDTEKMMDQCAAGMQKMRDMQGMMDKHDLSEMKGRSQGPCLRSEWDGCQGQA